LKEDRLSRSERDAQWIAVHPSTKEGMNRDIDQELFEAAEENDVPEVRRLLRAGADIEAKCDEGSTSLHKEGSTSLHKASMNGHSQVVNELLEHGAEIEAKDDNGYTALKWAGCEGHLAIVIKLLSPNDSNGTTTILGKRKSRGANIDAQDIHGNTTLHDASQGGHLPVVQALLSGGADILVINDEGELPVDQAVFEGESEVAKCLLQHLYATIRHLPLHKILEDIALIDNPNSIDAPPLSYAIHENALGRAIHQNVLGTDDVVDILEYLVDRTPALLCSRDQNGALPLHVACCLGASFSIVQFLVNRNGASVKSVTCQGDLPLFLACKMPETSLDTIFLLIKQNPRCDVVY
jgi:ankyrin repeat protein